jgi:uncharacterized protein YdeI (YjbR/CyaY-like superfamily)
MAQQVPLPQNSTAPATRAAWRQWLQRNHAASDGVWLVTRRKDATARAPTLEIAVEEAIAFGWSDGRTRSLDDARRLVWMAPRKPGSGWPRAHQEIATRLAAAGRMAPAGKACVAAAKRDGSWTVLDEVEALVVPPDLAAALARYGSADKFARMAPSKRRHALEWIRSARREATRAARVEETARLAVMDIVMTQWRLGSRR